MGNWHAPEEGNRERKTQQEQKPSGGETPGVARSATEGLSNKGLQNIIPGLTVQMKGMSGAVLDDSIARAIHSKRGSGETLDSGVASSMGDSMGHDFSDVNIHRDAEADTLNKQVQAEAFTTGKDVFFREGKYDPVSNEGQKLIAHELTHVVQQHDAPPAQELKVSDPNDASEQQASSVADTVTSAGAGASAGAGSVGRVSEEEAATHAMRGEEEESETEGSQTPMHMSVERTESGEAEEEEAATQVARTESGEVEEEEAATAVARTESGEVEEEEAATMVARDAASPEEDELPGHAM